MMKKRNRKGFTLIELVIVIAVLALLAAVAVPAVGGIIDDAKVSSDESNVALYQGAIERYNAETGNYPASRAAAVSAIKAYTNLETVGSTGLFAAPKSCASGQAFIYSANKISIGTPSTTADDAISAKK